MGARMEPCNSPVSGVNESARAMPTLTVIVLLVRYKCLSLETILSRDLCNVHKLFD